MHRAQLPVLPARFPAPYSRFYRLIPRMLPRCGAYTVQPLRGDLGESVVPGLWGTGGLPRGLQPARGSSGICFEALENPDLCRLCLRGFPGTLNLC